MITVAQGIHICLDNLSVAQAVGTNTKGSSQANFLRFRELEKAWLNTGKRLSVQWIPSHVGIEGNKLADKEAKRGQTWLAKKYKHWQMQKEGFAHTGWQAEWDKEKGVGAVKTYQDLGLRPTTNIKSQARDGLQKRNARMA